MIRIIVVGKKHSSELNRAIEGYEKRLKPPFDVTWVFLPHSSFESDRARQEESGRILARLSPADFVILLDERGKLFSSPEFGSELMNQNAVIIIGGAFGVNDEVRSRANLVVSLSRMVFPHQLARLILTEQIYRSQAIAGNHPYHHE